MTGERNMPLSGKIAIVTGGASGIGLASARLMAQSGATVVIADRNGPAAAAAAAEIVAGQSTASGHEVDVGDSTQVAQLVESVKSTHGRIDILLHAAGIYPKNPLLEMTDEQWRHVMRVNLDGTFYVTRDVARIMAEQRSGTMILMTSDRGVHGSVDFAHYAAAKGGMIALAKSLALNMGKFGVTVNGINPGLTDTPLARGGNPQWKEKQALDVLGTHSLPEEIAEIVLFLASTAGRFMTGQIVSTRMRHGA
jgi:NAD(P)-dependent dehydrogenase (short-subunit alcohol dehydrogenase family)